MNLRGQMRLGPIGWLVVVAFACGASAAAAQQARTTYPPPDEIRADFRKLLDREPVDLKPEFTSREIEGFTVQFGSFFSEADERVPAVIVRQTEREGRLPAILCLHGTGGSKDDCADLLRLWAQLGYVAMAIDARYHGDRVPGGATAAKQYDEAIMRAWRSKPGEKQEHPYWYDTAYDVWKTVDYLVSRSDVDPERIGMIGFSMGGIETWLAASVDTRVKVAIPTISVQSLGWALDNNQWQGRAWTIWGPQTLAARDLNEPQVNERVARALWNKLVPGSLDKFDAPSMLRLFAPRPVLIVNGGNDPTVPLGAAEVAFEQARAAYEAAGAEENLRIYVAPEAGHELTPDGFRLINEWLDRWLMP